MINLYDMKDIFIDVVREREAQFRKWGEQVHPLGNDSDIHGIHEHNYKLACDTNVANGCGKSKSNKRKRPPEGGLFLLDQRRSLTSWLPNRSARPGPCRCQPANARF